MSLSRVIYGQIPAKANNYKISGGRMYKSSEMAQYERDFAKQWVRTDTITERFELAVSVYFRSNASDLDNALKAILDMLQNVKAIENDRNCMKIEAVKCIDRLNPRIELKLTKISGFV